MLGYFIYANVVDVNNNRYYENQQKMLVLSGLNELLEPQHEYLKHVSRTVTWQWRCNLNKLFSYSKTNYHVIRNSTNQYTEILYDRIIT